VSDKRDYWKAERLRRRIEQRYPEAKAMRRKAEALTGQELLDETARMMGVVRGELLEATGPELLERARDRLRLRDVRSAAYLVDAALRVAMFGHQGFMRRRRSRRKLGGVAGA
jgi:hypothetical protein